LGHFTAILSQYGVTVSWKQKQSDGTFLDKGSAKAIIQPLRPEEVVVEAGYSLSSYRRGFASIEILEFDRMTFDGWDWEVTASLPFTSAQLGEEYRELLLRKVLA
jgi:hypothetical protein